MVFVSVLAQIIVFCLVLFLSLRCFAQIFINLNKI